MNDYPSYFISMHSWNRIVVVVGEREAMEMVVAGWLAGRTACIIKNKLVGGGGKEL
ncbi:hypothetical protein NC651_009930 [Populus alba x Populus x berolinensis]|nr:hypothetical protein NC651_009930 [Populus alba x Populus x berolinensis]